MKRSIFLAALLLFMTCSITMKAQVTDRPRPAEWNNLFVCGWLESSPKGHATWPGSIVFNAVSDKGSAWPGCSG